MLYAFKMVRALDLIYTLWPSTITFSERHQLIGSYSFCTATVCDSPSLKCQGSCTGQLHKAAAQGSFASVGMSMGSKGPVPSCHDHHIQ